MGLEKSRRPQLPGEAAEWRIRDVTLGNFVISVVTWSGRTIHRMDITRS